MRREKLIRECCEVVEELVASDWNGVGSHAEGIPSYPAYPAKCLIGWNVKRLFWSHCMKVHVARKGPWYKNKEGYAKGCVG